MASPIREVEVGRREAEPVAHAASVHDRADDGMWPTREQALCLRDRTLAQLAAYACRRNDLAVLLDELAGHVRAAVREGPSLDVGRRTARPHPEAKIRPREDGAWSHDASQEVEEGIRRHRKDLTTRR